MFEPKVNYWICLYVFIFFQKDKGLSFESPSATLDLGNFDGVSCVMNPGLCPNGLTVSGLFRVDDQNQKGMLYSTVRQLSVTVWK